MSKFIRKILDWAYVIAKRLYLAISRRFEDGGIIDWNANPDREKLRLDYDLNEDSLVFDIGGYKGQWASDIFSRYVCNIYIFEPVSEFSLDIKNRFVKNRKIRVFNFGLGSVTRKEKIYLNADGSSIFRDNGTSEDVQIVDIAEFIKTNSVKKVDLMKINIEGGEYELLERLINAGAVKKVKNIQVQFHNLLADSEKRMIAIQEQLRKTHKPTYQYKFIWENWELNEK